ncbi:MAG: exodeoxyribonuclease VII small subunit [Bacteroidia bacterium]|nr:exodeoxyribonuclease VII small subunit [Bacteroidia bacterium]
MAKKKQEDSFSFDNAVQEVELILNKLQKPEEAISMDDLVKEVTRASSLLADCEKYLSQTQQKINSILENKE